MFEEFMAVLYTGDYNIDYNKRPKNHDSEMTFMAENEWLFLAGRITFPEPFGHLRPSSSFGEEPLTRMRNHFHFFLTTFCFTGSRIHATCHRHSAVVLFIRRLTGLPKMACQKSWKPRDKVLRYTDQQSVQAVTPVKDANLGDAVSIGPAALRPDTTSCKNKGRYCQSQRQLFSAVRRNPATVNHWRRALQSIWSR